MGPWEFEKGLKVTKKGRVLTMIALCPETLQICAFKYEIILKVNKKGKQRWLKWEHDITIQIIKNKNRVVHFSYKFYVGTGDN